MSLAVCNWQQNALAEIRRFDFSLIFIHRIFVLSTLNTYLLSLFCFVFEENLKENCYQIHRFAPRIRPALSVHKDRSRFNFIAAILIPRMFPTLHDISSFVSSFASNSVAIYV